MAIKIFLLIWLVQLQMYYFYWHHTWDRLWTDRHKNSRWQLGSYIFLALPFFYAFTGCDISPSFCGKGRCKAYTVWVKSDRNDDFTDVFVELRETPIDVKSDHSDMLQSLVLQLYGSRHDTTCTLYHQAKKSFTNIFIVLFIKLGICEDSL